MLSAIQIGHHLLRVEQQPFMLQTCGNCRDGCKPLGVDTETGQAVGEVQIYHA